MKTCHLLFFGLIFSTAIANFLEVPTVAVTAVNSQQSTAPTNAHTLIISAKEIKQSGATNLEQVLNGLAGIQINDLTGDGSEASISIRGFGGNATQNSLILLNGMPLTNPDLSSPNLNLIPIRSIKKIEIFDGSEGVLFGDQAVGGVINIITKTPAQDSIYASATAGSYATTLLQEGFQMVGKNQLYASLNLKKYSSNNFREHNQNNTEQGYGSFGQQFQKSGWNFNYDFSHQLLELAGALTAEQVEENRRQAQNQTNFTDNNYDTYQFEQYHWLNNLWEEKFQGMHRQLLSSGILFDPFQENERENWGQISLIGLIKSILLTSGFSYANSNYGLNSNSYNISDQQHQISFFSQANISVLQKLSLIVGARSAWQQNQLLISNSTNLNNSAFVTNIGLNYQWKPWLSLFLRQAESYRFPKTDEEALTENGIGGLKTQTGVSYELGLNTNTGRWTDTVSLFVLNLKNELAFDPTPLPTQPFGVNSNLDPTRRMGGLLNINYQLQQNWLIGVQYTHVAAKFSEGLYQGNDIPYVAANTGSIYSNYQLFNYWNLFSQIVFIGKRFAEGDVANEFPRMPAVTLVNLALRYQKNCIFAMFRINNIFNNDYNAFSTVSTISVTPFQQEQFFYPAPGRNYSISIGFKLQ